MSLYASMGPHFSPRLFESPLTHRHDPGRWGAPQHSRYLLRAKRCGTAQEAGVLSEMDTAHVSPQSEISSAYPAARIRITCSTSARDSATPHLASAASCVASLMAVFVLLLS